MAVVTITKDNFEAEVLGCKIPVVLDFWAEWCEPCKMQSTVIEELAAELDGKVKFGKVNVDEEASLALGATKIETIFRVSLPAAKSGVATAIVLGVGRAIGEAMAIIMVSGNVANMPDLFGSVRFLTTAIASEMSYASVGSLQRDALFSIGLVLFLFIMLINVFLNLVIKRKKEGE